MDDMHDTQTEKTTVSIIQASGGELANQLWNYISVYAYAKDRGFILKNPSFYEYGHFFALPKEHWFFSTFFFGAMAGNTKRKWSFKKRLWRKAYSIISRRIIALHKEQSLHVEDSHTPFYLPPSIPNQPSSERYAKQYEILRALEAKRPKTLYLSGWLYRNPIGIEKYREDIVSYFKPKASLQASVDAFMQPLRHTYRHVIGVHIRQGDYATWQNGAYFLPQERVATALREYMKEHQLQSAETCFVFASDGPIRKELFADMNIQITGKTMVEDLFILAATDCVLGSNSTFGDFAAYYGNVPHIIIEKGPIDWTYYAEKNTFFPNKYCSWVHY